MKKGEKYRMLMGGTIRVIEILDVHKNGHVAYRYTHLGKEVITGKHIDKFPKLRERVK